jgi:hypothetical protein
VDFANGNSPIPGFSTKIVPSLHGFTQHGIFYSPKSVLSGDPLYFVNWHSVEPTTIGHTFRNGILFPNLFWPTVRKKCSTDLEKLLKFEVKGQEFSKILRLLKQFIQTVKGQNNFWNQMLF